MDHSTTAGMSLRDKAKYYGVSRGEMVSVRVVFYVMVVTAPVWIPIWYVHHLLRRRFSSSYRERTS